MHELTPQIWRDDKKELLKQDSDIAPGRAEEFRYPLVMFVLNATVTALFSGAAVFFVLKGTAANEWLLALIFLALGIPAWKNLVAIYRGPRAWVIDRAADTVHVKGFDGTESTWRLSSLRRDPANRLGRPYRILDQDGHLAFEIWMFVQRQDELAHLFRSSAE